MNLFNTNTATDATPTDAGFDVSSIMNGLTTVFGFFRKIIDFLKGIFTPLFESLFKSAAEKLDEVTGE